MNSNKKSSGIVITFYVFAVILLVIFAFSVYSTYDSIQSYIAGYQMTFADGWIMFISSFFQACVPPFVGAILCYGVASIIQKLETTQHALATILQDAEDAYRVDDEDVVESIQEVEEASIEEKEEIIEQQDENAK